MTAEKGLIEVCFQTVHIIYFVARSCEICVDGAITRTQTIMNIKYKEQSHEKHRMVGQDMLTFPASQILL